MDERPDQIINEIETHRDELGRNLQELEHRVRRTADWRTYYERNPMMMIGAALGGGVLLGSVIGRRGHSGSSHSTSSSSWSIPYADTQGKTQSSGSTSSRSSSLGESAMGLSSAGAGYAAGSYSSPSMSQSSQSSGSSMGSKLSSVAAPLKSAMQRSEVSDTLEHFKSALVGFGIAKAREFLTQAVPGIDHHLSEAERKHKGDQKQGFGSFSGSSEGQWQGHGDSQAHGSEHSQHGQHGSVRSSSEDQQNSFGSGSTWDTKTQDSSSPGSSGSAGSGSSSGSEHHTPAVTY